MQTTQTPTQFPLAARREALKARLDAAFPAGFGYARSFDVRLARQKKHEPRSLQITWSVFPFEEAVTEALDDLMAEDVALVRGQSWSCGRFHTDQMDAWKAHEGDHHLVYPDSGDGNADYLGDKTLPDEVEETLLAEGETFESACRLGNFVACPTCGGYGRLTDRSTFWSTPCPECVSLGLDQSPFPGFLDLDVPEHRSFYEGFTNTRRAASEAEARRETAKREKAMQQPTTTRPPSWRVLPTRAAGLINGIPVHTSADCDYLSYANNPDRAHRCTNDARWFEPKTGLRVCTRHKNY